MLQIFPLQEPAFKWADANGAKDLRWALQMPHDEILQVAGSRSQVCVAPNETLRVAFCLQSCQGPRRIFSVERSADGKRSFLVSTYRAFWARYQGMLPQHRHYYEIIRQGWPCHLYFGEAPTFRITHICDSLFTHLSAQDSNFFCALLLCLQSWASLPVVPVSTITRRNVIMRQPLQTRLN